MCTHQVESVWKLFGPNAKMFLAHTASRFMAEMVLYANSFREPGAVFAVTMGNFARYLRVYFNHLIPSV